MSLSPARTKYRKVFNPKRTTRRIATSATQVAFGTYGLKIIKSSILTANQIEAARKIISRYTKRSGRVFIRVFPHLPYTDKPSDQRMGGGKGPVDKYVARVSAGTIIFEIDNVTPEIANEVFKKVLYKLPVAGVIVRRKFVCPIS